MIGSILKRLLYGPFFSVCGQVCGQTKTVKVGGRSLTEKNNKNRPFSKENGLFLVVERKFEPAISVL